MCLQYFVSCLHVRFIFHCRSFSTCWPLAFLILSPPLQNFHVVLPSLKIDVALFLVELYWPAAYFLFFTVFLLLYIPNDN